MGVLYLISINIINRFREHTAYKGKVKENNLSY